MEPPDPYCPAAKNIVLLDTSTLLPLLLSASQINILGVYCFKAPENPEEFFEISALLASLFWHLVTFRSVVPGPFACSSSEMAFPSKPSRNCCGLATPGHDAVKARSDCKKGAGGGVCKAQQPSACSMLCSSSGICHVFLASHHHFSTHEKHYIGVSRWGI